MVIPALPPDDIVGAVWSAAKVNAIYDHLQLYRDTHPVFQTKVNTQSILDSTDTIASFSDGAGAFLATPTINVGGFTASAISGDVLAPEPGVYLVRALADFTANATGFRSLQIRDNGVLWDGSLVRLAGASSAYSVSMSTTALIHVEGAGQALGVNVHQTSGIGISFSCHIECLWIGSSIA